jgi:formylglycine-generating enzyme required for sulfatase activity
VRELVERLAAAGASVEAALPAPPEAEQEAKQKAEQKPEKKREAQRSARELAVSRKMEAGAQAAAQAVIERQRKQQLREDRLARLAAEEARRLRKEELRRQLAERRALDAEKARLAREQAQRKLVQARGAAAYLQQQERARAGEAARTEAEPEVATAAPDSPVAGPGSVLRDRFLVGEGTGPELVLLPAGRFQMGSPEHEREVAMKAGTPKGWLARELPQHWVGIVKTVAMGRYPVTVGEWRIFVQATGWRPGGEVDWEAPGFAQTALHPVVGVNWYDARQYLDWLSEATGHRYRLPSEAEWEYACRAGTKTAFSFGDSISDALANYDGNFTYNGGARGELRRGTTPAGMFPPNPWGLFDMHGNVWEWVQDVVHDHYEGAPLDGSPWEEGGDQARRILRGGSSSGLSNDIVGFRVVRELMQAAA